MKIERAILATLWLKRFVQTLIVIGIILSTAELASGEAFDFTSVGVWSVIASVVAASVSTYWAYKKRCKMVYK